jgi:hypothetical protein
VWLASGDSVQHLRFAEVRMDRPGRLFLCARCRVQVVLCSHCDRGNRYCGRVCRRLARDAARRASASRYQRSWRGRLAHAERSRRWRQRHAARGTLDDCGDASGLEHNVTHKGCPPGHPAALLVACTPNTTPVLEPAGVTVRTVSVAAPASAMVWACISASISASPSASTSVGATATLASPWMCRGCARPVSEFVRQNFLRHGPRWRSGSRHDHSP